MVEISTVLYWTVMQWAGYSKDKKVAYLQFMLEKDGKMEAFEKRITELSKGKTWKQIQNQPLVVNQFASRLAHEVYPEVFPDATAFQKLRVDEAENGIRVSLPVDVRNAPVVAGDDDVLRLRPPGREFPGWRRLQGRRRGAAKADQRQDKDQPLHGILRCHKRRRERTAEAVSA